MLYLTIKEDGEINQLTLPPPLFIKKYFINNFSICAKKFTLYKQRLKIISYY